MTVHKCFTLRTTDAGSLHNVDCCLKNHGIVYTQNSLLTTHLAEVCKNADKFCDVDIAPLKRGRLISFHKRSSESVWIPKVYLHDVPHWKYDKALIWEEFLISWMFSFGHEILQNSSPANQPKTRIWNLTHIVTKTRTDVGVVCALPNKQFSLEIYVRPLKLYAKWKVVDFLTCNHSLTSHSWKAHSIDTFSGTES